MAKKAGQSFATGFQPRKLPPQGYPYVLVQIHKTNMPAGYDDIERGLSQGRRRRCGMCRASSATSSRD